MTVGSKVVLFGKTAAEVVAVSSNGRSVHVLKADGTDTWTKAENAKVVA